MPERRTRDRAIDPDAVEVAKANVLSPAAHRDAQRIITSFCDPTRLQMLRALRRTPLAASDLAQVVGKTRSATSQHLRRLRDAEVVVSQRKGNIVRYRFADSGQGQILAQICDAFDKLAA